MKHLRDLTWRLDRFGVYCLVWQDGELVAGWSFQWPEWFTKCHHTLPGYSGWHWEPRTKED